MDHSAATGRTHSPMIKSANSEKIIISSSHCASTLSASGSVRENEEDQVQLQWAASERLPTFQRLRFSLFDDSIGGRGPASTDVRVKRVIDVAKLGALERHAVLEKLIKNVENDNRRLLQKLRERTEKVDERLPTVEVRYKNLSVEAEREVVYGKPLPTLWSTVKRMFSASVFMVLVLTYYIDCL